MKSVQSMTYYELRREAARLVPRMLQLTRMKGNTDMVREKGRKKGYSQFDLKQKEFVKQERLLDKDEIHSFVEVSCRAAACPMPLNLDVWDGLWCPFGCKYCFANAFRSSLYTAFFDNSKSLGFRHCNPDTSRRELDKLMKFRRTDPQATTGDVRRAIAMEIPLRLGIRFEDFMPIEKEKGVSLAMLNYLADIDYPVMINTKSALVAEDAYLTALSRNRGRAAVHVTLISSDDAILKKLEPQAPSYAERLETIRRLSAAGVRTVARIEPFLVMVNDDPDRVEEYIENLQKAGCSHITLDTYSYSAYNQGISQAFYNEGFDFERLFLLGCDSQPLGSLLLDRFMDLFRSRGFSCSTFDVGCSATNNQTICCEVGDWFKGGWNWGSIVAASRFVIQRGGKPTRWVDFHSAVMKRGGFLSDALEREVHQLWNQEGNEAYHIGWATGLNAIGYDGDIVWTYNKGSDFRQDTVGACL